MKKTIFFVATKIYVKYTSYDRVHEKRKMLTHDTMKFFRVRKRTSMKENLKLNNFSTDVISPSSQEKTIKGATRWAIPEGRPRMWKGKKKLRGKRARDRKSQPILSTILVHLFLCWRQWSFKARTVWACPSLR